MATTAVLALDTAAGRVTCAPEDALEVRALDTWLRSSIPAATGCRGCCPRCASSPAERPT